MARVNGLQIYPLKSGGARCLDEVRVGPTGFSMDRYWMVIQPDGTFVNQRKNRRLAAIEVSIGEEGKVTFWGKKNQTPLVIDMTDLEGRPQLQAHVYDSACTGVDLGPLANDWISRELGEAVILLQQMPQPTRAAHYDEEEVETPIAFQDAGTILVTSEASLRDLNRRIRSTGEEAVPMDRFRPNLIVKGCDPYEEETWRRVRVGEVELELTMPSRRCAITTYDQKTGDMRGPEPLRTLATYRRWQKPGSTKPPQPIFGMNANHRGRGIIRVGDEIEVIERGDPYLVHELAT